MGAWEHGDNGKAFVFSGANGFLLYTLEDPNPTPWDHGFSRGLAGAGDVNFDSVPDIIVGHGGKDVTGKESQGRAFVFSGVDGSLLYILDNPYPQAEAQFGASLAALGDVSGDGIPDIAVGARGQEDGQGKVFVFSGVDGSLLTTLDHPSPQPGDGFGDPPGFGVLAALGDVNGDSMPDIAVGAGRQAVDGNIDQGQAYVFNFVLDADGDGVVDAVDQCPDSDLTATVIIDGRSTGVENQLLEDGCTISDRIAECAVGVRNHGEFVSNVAHLTNYLKKAGVINGREKGAIQSCAAKADIP